MKYKVGDIVIRTEYNVGAIGEIVEVKTDIIYIVKVLYSSKESGLEIGTRSQWTNNYFRKYTKLDRLLDEEVIDIDTER